MSTDDDNPIALKRSARFFFAVAAAAALFCAYSAIGTLRFISESTLAEGTVVDWAQGRARRSSGTGAYFRIIEIEAPNGQRIRGEAEVGVEMRRLKIGERLAVRYRDSDPTRMRVVSLSDLWLGTRVWRDHHCLWSGRLVVRGTGAKALWMIAARRHLSSRCLVMSIPAIRRRPSWIGAFHRSCSSCSCQPPSQASGCRTWRKSLSRY